VQEWVPGGELFHHLDIEGSFSDAAACFYAANVLLALECLHARGIVYRDLKPENLLLDTKVGVLRVMLRDWSQHKTLKLIHTGQGACRRM
jgi:serine/threonine protein kinase